MYEIPDSVILEVSINDTQLSFIRKALMQTAYLAGLPLLEAVSFALLYLPSSLNDQIYKTDWSKAKGDPTPQDGVRVKNNEFAALRGKQTTYYLSENEKLGLKLRQMFYVLHGGVLGSKLETLSGDLIVVNLKIVFDEKQFNETTAKETIKTQIDDAVNVYGQIEIKFDIIWTAGAGNLSTLEITKGRKGDSVNVFLSIGEGGATSVTKATKSDTGEIETYDIFLLRQKLSIKGFSDNSLNTWALAHELGHKFGIVGYSGSQFFGFDTSNWSSDAATNLAILKARTGSVVKGVDWDRSPFVKSIRGDLAPTTFDLLRTGAKRLRTKI